MYRKKLVAYLFLLSLILTNILGGITVYADRSEVDSMITLDTGSSAVSGICYQANDVVGITILYYTGSDGLLSFSNKEYSKLSSEEKREFMETALKATRESSLGVQQKNKVYNFISQQDTAVSQAVKYLQSDTSADFATARAWFAPFSGPIGVVIGLMCILIDLFLGLSMLFDLMYLNLPGFQAILERGEENKRPFGVSREAWKANQDAEKVGESRNVMSIYMKKRIPVILLIAFCLAYVISGQIYNFVVFFIDSFQNVF